MAAAGLVAAPKGEEEKESCAHKPCGPLPRCSLGVCPTPGLKKFTLGNRNQRIRRADSDGTNAEELIRSARLAFPGGGVAMNAADGSVYWTNAGDRSIQRCSRHGSDPVDVPICDARGSSHRGLGADRHRRGSDRRENWPSVDRKNEPLPKATECGRRDVSLRLDHSKGV